MIAEAKLLRQHKGRLEARMQILEDHNRQLEAQLQRLRQLLDDVSTYINRLAQWYELFTASDSALKTRIGSSEVQGFNMVES